MGGIDSKSLNIDVVKNNHVVQKCGYIRYGYVRPEILQWE